MKATITINPNILQWLKNNISSFPSKNTTVFLENCDNGEKHTLNQIMKISSEMQIPFGYFFLKTPPIEENHLLEYRTTGSIKPEKASRNLIDTISQMEKIQDWMHDYLISENFDKIECVGSLKNETNIIYIAKTIKQKLNLSDNWLSEQKKQSEGFNKLKKAINNLGILVMTNGIVGSNTKRVLDINEFRAFTMIDSYAPLIFINNRDSQNGKLFSLTHELIHIFLGKDSLYNIKKDNISLISKTETLCNAVAAEILLPQHLFIKAWKLIDNDTNFKISSIATKYRCSSIVVARKALENNFINNHEYQKITKECIKKYYEQKEKEKKDKEPSPIYYPTMAARIDHSFFMALFTSVQEGKTLYSDAFRLTNTNRVTFNKLNEKILESSLER